MSSPPPSAHLDLDLESDQAQQRLSQLEALLAGSLFAAPSAPTTSHPDPAQGPSTERKKAAHPSPPSPTAPEQGLQAEEAVAFRLFSSQKAPQKVVLREAETPPPFVVDRRIRDVDDEDSDAVEARRRDINALAVDGETILSQSRLPPAAPPPAHQLSHRALSASSHPSRSLPLPRLAYLNAVLPSPLSALSPHPVPFPEHLEARGELPPPHPHAGLLAVAPLPGVYARTPRRRRFNGEGKEAHEFVPVEEGAAKRRGMPPRNAVERAGRCPLVVRAILREERPEDVKARLAKEAKGAGQGKKGKRLSKARRARARRSSSGANASTA